MDEKSLKAYLNEALQETARPQRMEETIELCRGQVRDYRVSGLEERTGFLAYLSDIFRYEGAAIFGLQAIALLIACLGISAATDTPENIPFYMPLFSMAIMPVLFRGQIHGVSELEAATRASGAQIVLAKLLLAGAANLVCMTVFLCVELHLEKAFEGIGRLILYVLVPYLSCMVFMLRGIRLCRRESIWQCMTTGLLSCLFWGLSARLVPWLYELSAGGVWVIAFVVFGGFFVKEIFYIWEMRKEGKMYGIIA